jgi:hypothetical protein
MRKISAVVLGALLALLVRFCTQLIIHARYPSPPDADLHNPQVARTYFETVPPGALIVVLVAWGLITLLGAWFAGFIAKEKPLFYAAFVGLLVLVATVINFIDIPHPSWFMITAVLVIPIAAWLGGMWGERSLNIPG